MGNKVFERCILRKKKKIIEKLEKRAPIRNFSRIGA